jgi:hypothetical protein
LPPEVAAPPPVAAAIAKWVAPTSVPTPGSIGPATRRTAMALVETV